jgi:trk system potassium uptake protein TrkH
MNVSGVLFLLGRLLLVLAAALLVPAAVGYAYDEAATTVFLGSAAAVGLAGILLQHRFRQPQQFRFGKRDAYLLVASAWIMASVVGAVPYALIEGMGFVVDGLFESASGFTTTGASVFSDLDSIPRALLLWRSLTHWLGGMGIIVLGIAILPKLSIGGMELLGAEAPGPITEKLTPRIAQTAKALWGIYAGLTLIEALALTGLGMTPFEAVNHAFATMATGGFSTHPASVGGFASPAIEWVVTVFMLLAGANFALHFHLVRGRPGPLWHDPEFRVFLGVVAAATLMLSTDLLTSGRAAGLHDAVRVSAFQAASIVTTTGFATADFDTWSSFARALLVALMFVGGCAGSTGGSIKVVRIMIVVKRLVATIKQQVTPTAVLPVRVGRRAIPDDVVGSVVGFAAMFLMLFAVGGLLLTLMGLDVISAFTASAACLGNIGPGLGVVGPAQTYAPLPAAAKLLLVGGMIIGRLELYTVLVLFFLLGRVGLRR